MAYTSEFARSSPKHQSPTEGPRRSGRRLPLVGGGFLLLFGLIAVQNSRLHTAAQDGPVAVRYHEGLALTLEDAPDVAAAFAGAAIADVYAYAYDGAAWTRIAMQVDERDATALFVAEEDGLIDANDEIAWLYDDAGLAAEDGMTPAGMADAQAAAVIAVDDPLRADEPDATRWLYLFHAPGGSEDAAPAELVRYDAEAREVRTSDYVLGFASSAVEDDGFFGIKRLSLSGDLETDLVDRTKFRANVDLFGQALALTEENLGTIIAQFGGAELNFDVEPIKGGAVRAILSAAGGSAWPRRAMLTVAPGVAEGLPGGDGPIAIPITNLRLSLDLNLRAVEAGATYRDPNLSEPVAIDGVPDTVPDAPLPAWRELGLPTARALLLGGVDAADAPTARAFYTDLEAGLDGDTGDGRSLGEHGVTADEIGDLFAAGFPGEMVVVPADEFEDLGAEALLAAQEDPLAIRVASVTGGPPAATATPVPSPTPEVEGHTIHLPWNFR